MLLGNRCFKWGSTDCTVTHHLSRRCGERPTVLIYLWSSEATHIPCRNLTHPAGHAGRGCLVKGGSAQTGTGGAPCRRTLSPLQSSRGPCFLWVGPPFKEWEEEEEVKKE